MSSSVITPKKVDSTSNDLNTQKDVKPSATNTKTNNGIQSNTSGKTIKWPPASSAKSLPPLSGRISDLLHQTQQLMTSKNDDDANGNQKRCPTMHAKDVIEFEVNQECKKPCVNRYNCIWFLFLCHFFTSRMYLSYLV